MWLTGGAALGRTALGVDPGRLRCLVCTAQPGARGPWDTEEGAS